jgi:hypothetical protein
MKWIVTPREPSDQRIPFESPAQDGRIDEHAIERKPELERYDRVSALMSRDAMHGGGCAPPHGSAYM